MEGANWCSMMGFGFGWVFTLIFWVLIVWAIIAVVGALAGKKGNWHNYMRGEDEAMKILRERYAKGEIEKEEFERRKTDLMPK